MNERMNEDLENLSKVKLNHALVFNCSISDFEAIKKFILGTMNSKVIFEKHSSEHLIITVDGKGGG